MKVVVELEDFWMHEDGDFQEEFAQFVAHNVKSEIWQSIKNEAYEKVFETVKQELVEEIKQKIGVIVAMVAKEPIFFTHYGSKSDADKGLTLEDYARKLFNDYHESGAKTTIQGVTKKTAEVFANEMRDRYDLSFAAQLVCKLNEQGLLKEGAYDSIKNQK